MTKTRLKYYVCKKMRLLTYLMSKGYMYIKIDKDKTNPNYSVWIFEDTPELRKEVDRYYKNIPKKEVII